MNYIIAVFLLGLLIFIHELGHFVLAKLCGVRVEAFSVGFGPRLFGFERGGTEYKVSLVPFGGYVKMKGEEPGEEKSGEPDEFSSRPVYQRMLVILAGPFVNLVFGFFVFWMIYLAIGTNVESYSTRIGAVVPVYRTDGTKEPSPAMRAAIRPLDRILSVNGAPVQTFLEVSKKIQNSGGAALKFLIERDGKKIEVEVNPVVHPKTGHYYAGIRSLNEPVIGKLIEGRPASIAGLRPGDKIISVNDRACTEFTDVKREIFFSRGETIVLKVDRDGAVRDFVVRPLKKPLPTAAIPGYDIDTDLVYNGTIYVNKGVESIDISQIGIYPMTVKLRFPFLKSLEMAYIDTVNEIERTAWTLKMIATLKVKLSHFAGPVGIIHLTGEQAAAGLEEVLRLTAIISIMLWFFNLLPIPVLDGGWIMFLLFESIFRRPVPLKIQGILQQAFFILLISVLVMITFVDIRRMWDEQAQLSESRVESSTPVKK